jgi:hypothetical protein
LGAPAVAVLAFGAPDVVVLALAVLALAVLEAGVLEIAVLAFGAPDVVVLGLAVLEVEALADATAPVPTSVPPTAESPPAMSMDLSREPGKPLTVAPPPDAGIRPPPGEAED